mgnify:CR=1 FL=1
MTFFYRSIRIFNKNVIKGGEKSKKFIEEIISFITVFLLNQQSNSNKYYFYPSNYL